MADEQTENSMASLDSENRAKDDMIIQQKEAIESAIKKAYKLIDDTEDVKVLETEFASDETFRKNAGQLQKKYANIRRTRPDGNCYYRAVAFAQFERMLKDADEAKRFRKLVEEAKNTMIQQLGYPEFTTEDFYDNFVDEIDKLSDSNIDKLVETFNDQGISDYIVTFMRLLTSMKLRQDSELYVNFMENEMDVDNFCKNFVDPMGIESDHVQIHALSSAMGTTMRIVYLDRSVHEDLSVHEFPESSPNPAFSLLYRPGHYDLLYPK